MASDAIVVGEDWISEHYFTTDATKESFKARVLARRRSGTPHKEQRRPRAPGSPPPAPSLLDRLATLDATTTTTRPTCERLNADVRADPRLRRRSGCTRDRARAGHLRHAPPA